MNDSKPAQPEDIATRDAVARTICAELGRYCEEQHPCDPCPEHCQSAFLYNDAAVAVIKLLRGKN